MHIFPNSEVFWLRLDSQKVILITSMRYLPQDKAIIVNYSIIQNFSLENAYYTIKRGKKLAQK